MQLVDRGLGWLWRVVLMVGLLIGVVLPPMLLRIINQLYQDNELWGWQLALSILYFVVFGLLILSAGAVTRQYSGQLQLKRLQRRDFKIIIGGYGLIMLLEAVFQVLNQLIYHQDQTQNNSAIKALMGGSPAAMWMMGISAIFLTPIVEELIFRGALTNLFFKRSWLKVLLSGLVFGSLHTSSTLPSFLIYVTMGLLLATVYRLSGKIMAAITLHFIINAGAIGLMLVELIV